MIILKITYFLIMHKCEIQNIPNCIPETEVKYHSLDGYQGGFGRQKDKQSLKKSKIWVNSKGFEYLQNKK